MNSTPQVPAQTGLILSTQSPISYYPDGLTANMSVVGNSSSNMNSTEAPDHACYYSNLAPSVQISHTIYIYAALFFFIIGLVGNTLSMVVFSSKGMRTQSSNVYLLMLAFSDMMYLITVALTKIWPHFRCTYFKASKADVYNYTDVGCVFLQLMSDLFSDYSACLILAFTIERFIACYQPMKFKAICTVVRARVTCLAILLVIIIFISPYHALYMGLYPQAPSICIVLLDFENEFTILYMIEAVLFRIIPVFIIAVMNMFIIFKVSRVHAEWRKRHATSRAQNNNKKNQQQDKHLQLTVMLILVSSSYIILYLPVLVYFVLTKLVRSGNINIDELSMDLMKDYTSLLYVSGFAINFFLYTMSGKVFRDQLELILCDARIRQQAKLQHENVDEKQTLV